MKDSGFKAYLVGGCVRDLMLGREPKDFDVATDALPEQVEHLFKNCRLIGRRFRLAHIHFKGEIIEVATFRGSHNGDEKGGEIQAGRIVRDNVFGSIEEDAVRRDFSVNALYYNIDDFSVVDYLGGVDDLKNGVLRLIGDPAVRYREDPVRMLRAVRFISKLGFRPHPDSEAPLFKLGGLLEDISPSRLFDEMLKLFLSGSAVQNFELLRHYDLFAHLFPYTDKALEEQRNNFPQMLLINALANTDLRLEQGKPVTPAFLFAAFLWPALQMETANLIQNGMTEAQAIQTVARKLIQKQSQCVSLPRRFSIVTREIWALQPRLKRNKGKRALAVLKHQRFRAAYDFLLLRTQAGEDYQALVDWWTQIQEQDEGEQHKMCRAKNHQRKKHSRRRKPPKKIAPPFGSPS